MLPVPMKVAGCDEQLLGAGLETGSTVACLNMQA